MYMTSKITKELTLPNTGTWTINEAILAAGQATADNLAPNFSQIQYASRCPTLEMQERIYAILDNNADNVARIAHCILRKEWVTKTRPGLPNHAVAALAYGNLSSAERLAGGRRPSGLAARSRRTWGSSRCRTQFILR